MNDFKDLIELIEYLYIPGNSIEYKINKSETIYFMDSNKKLFYIHDNIIYNTEILPIDLNSIKKVIKKKWYDSIPDHGVLCRCGYKDTPISSNDYIAVIKYRNIEGKFGTLSGSIYSWAHPLEPHEVNKFIYREE